MPDSQPSHATPAETGALALSGKIFSAVEHWAYTATGILLACTAVLALVGGGVLLIDAARHWGDAEQIVATIDQLLFVLMLLEILHTVRVSVRDGALTAEPFLIVGLIASIRRVLVITLGSSQSTHAASWTPEIRDKFNGLMLELGVLAVLILVMVVAIYLLRRPRT